MEETEEPRAGHQTLDVLVGGRQATFDPPTSLQSVQVFFYDHGQSRLSHSDTVLFSIPGIIIIFECGTQKVPLIAVYYEACGQLNNCTLAQPREPG